MKKRSLTMGMLLLIAYCSFSQRIGIGTNNPDTSAILHINHTGKGLLIPRMTTAGIAAIRNPAKGLMAYDTQLHRLMVNMGTPGISDWRHIAFKSAWGLEGNEGIDADIQFVGTTDEKPLRFRVNNIQAGELNPLTENVSWGMRAGMSNTTGSNNIAIGTGALRSNTTRSNIVAIGDSALFNNGLNAIGASQAIHNTAVGSKALYANTTGSGNTAIGYRSMHSNNIGSQNTATGYSSLYSNTSGFSNTANGHQALYYNTTGSVNTAVGYQTLYGNVSGTDNTATGYQSLFMNNGGSANTAIGNQALYSSLGSANTALGYRALFSNSTGSGTTAVGYQALYFNQSNENTAVGSLALYYNSSGNDNTAMGYQALYQNTTGGQNTAVGQRALQANTGAGQYNTAVGAEALEVSPSSQYNTAIGYYAGSNHNLGWNNTIIGATASTHTADMFNCVALGMNAIATSNSQVRLGNTAITSVVGQVGYSTQSDGRFKKNIKEDVKGIEFIMKLRPVTYQLDVSGLNKKLGVSDKDNAPFQKAVADQEKTIFTGFIAQEVEQAAKEAGYDFSGVDKPKHENDLYALRYAEFVVPLVKASQEQQRMLDELKTQTAELKKSNAGQASLTETLVKRLETLESTVYRKK